MEGERLCCVAVWRVLWFTFSITHMWKPNNGLSHLHPQHTHTGTGVQGWDTGGGVT